MPIHDVPMTPTLGPPRRRISNPTTLLQWAIATGRVPATDYALWAARLTGAGRDAWAEVLLTSGGTSRWDHGDSALGAMSSSAFAVDLHETAS